jgi:hypothetical protein
MAKRKNGEGTVRLRNDGRWEGRVVIGYDDKGNPKTKSVLTHTKGECLEKLEKLKEECGRTAEKLKPDMPFGEWIDFWYKYFSSPKLRPTTQATYENRIMMLFAVITGLSLLQSVGMSILAKPLIWVIYGEDYLPAASVLQISVWYVAFGYYGSVRNVWILAEEKQQYLWIIDLSGAICNVLCNWIMIPMWGACGAAIASLTTQMLINVVLCFFLREMRPCGVLMLKSFRIKHLIDIARGMRGRI